MTRAALLVLLAVLVPSPALADTFDGRGAVIIDGDTFAIGSERVRILETLGATALGIGRDLVW
jgi:hypothetical protein